MTSRVLEMAKTYIVYKFYEGDRQKDKATDKLFKTAKVTKVPTLVVFDEGKPVARYTGIVDSAKVLKGVKTRKEQNWSWLDWRPW